MINGAFAIYCNETLAHVNHEYHHIFQNFIMVVFIFDEEFAHEFTAVSSFLSSFRDDNAIQDNAIHHDDVPSALARIGLEDSVELSPPLNEGSFFQRRFPARHGGTP